MDVVQFSQQTKQEANDLLEYGNVLEVLSRYGEVQLTGAYKYDLMWGADIDITVTTDQPEEAATKALNEFIGARNFRKYQLGDFIKHAVKNRPQAIIVVLIHEYQGRKWEIEIWFEKTVFQDANYFNSMLSSASDEQRKTILNLKYQREKSGASKHTLSSANIYSGVLLENKQRIEDF